MAEQIPDWLRRTREVHGGVSRAGDETMRQVKETTKDMQKVAKKAIETGTAFGKRGIRNAPAGGTKVDTGRTKIEIMRAEWIEQISRKFPSMPKGLSWENTKNWVRENTPFRVMIEESKLTFPKEKVKDGEGIISKLSKEKVKDGEGIISKLFPGGGTVKDFFDRPKSWLQDFFGGIGGLAKMGMLVNLLIFGIIVGAIVMIAKAVWD